jgi:hypothetical protein
VSLYTPIMPSRSDTLLWRSAQRDNYPNRAARTEKARTRRAISVLGGEGRCVSLYTHIMPSRSDTLLWRSA